MRTNVHTNPILEVKNVSVDYLAGNGAVHAVDDVSFTLNRGEIMGLAGERDRKSTRLNSSHSEISRMPSSA